MRVLTKIEIFLCVNLLFASINAKNWDCKNHKYVLNSLLKCERRVAAKPREEAGDQSSEKETVLRKWGRTTEGKPLERRITLGRRSSGGEESRTKKNIWRCSLRCCSNLQLLWGLSDTYCVGWSLMMAAVKVTFVLRDE